MKKVIVKGFALILLLGVVYGVANYTGLVASYAKLYLPFSVDVKGASTKKAQEISGKLATDVERGVDQATNQALQFTLGDLLQSVSRGQKIVQDAQVMKDSLIEQVSTVVGGR